MTIPSCYYRFGECAHKSHDHAARVCILNMGCALREQVCYFWYVCHLL